MKRRMNNEKGITLVELLAAIAISSIVAVFIIALYLSIQKQYTGQSEQIKNLTDITIAAKAITKDLRSAIEVDVDENNDKEIFIKIQIDEEEEEITYLFDDEENILRRNGAPYLYQLRDFKVEEENYKVSFEFKSETGKALKTDIVIREGQDDEEADESTE